jgi:hypothetical protein
MYAPPEILLLLVLAITTKNRSAEIHETQPDPMQIPLLDYHEIYLQPAGVQETKSTDPQ